MFKRAQKWIVLFLVLWLPVTAEEVCMKWLITQSQCPVAMATPSTKAIQRTVVSKESLIKEPMALNDSSVNDNNETLKNTTFLTFNEWKQAKLDNDKANLRSNVRMRDPVDPACYRDKESMGEEMEIELGFFTNDGSTNEQVDAGGEPEARTYKDKFNYASLDCAATIMQTNSKASGATSILIENKDKYLLNPCSATNKFVVIELCQDILVEEIVLANFEFFSSTFHRVRFLVSDVYPVSKSGWKSLGEFDAENSRELQRFKIDSSLIWARYLKIEVLSHYDNEYYCPISLVRVHGKSMMDEFKMSNIEESANEKSAADERIQQLQASKLKNGKECVSLPLNISDPHPMLLELPEDDFLSCTSHMAPLNFEEFLKALNGTYCPPRSKETISTTQYTPSGLGEESIFKNIMKRIGVLESNATLTVLYIEEQSKLLAESFAQLEKSHAERLDNLLHAFNKTVVANLESLGAFANQLKEQSIRILEEQKLNSELHSTQNIITIQKMESDLAFQRNILYMLLLSLSAVVIYVILSKELSLEDSSISQQETRKQKDDQQLPKAKVKAKDPE